MVSVEEALDLVKKHCSPLEERDVRVVNCLNFILSRDVESPIALPSFRQSAMDGWAVKRSDLESGLREFEIVGEIPAGVFQDINLSEGQTVRIFTGACVPDSADTVVIQEKTKQEGSLLQIVEYSSKDKTNIREVGEQIAKGKLALEKGHRVDAATSGFLSAMGLEKVFVHRKPGIAFIGTGDELKRPGQELKTGEIYESNSATISAALQEANFFLSEERRVRDELKDTVNQLDAALSSNDVVIISGGISVGDYDFVKEALEKCGVTEVFYKVLQKPGKPMYFGTKGDKLVFALPGNPASLLTCFYVYVLPALNAIFGAPFDLTMGHVPLNNGFNFKGDRPVFLKGYFNGEHVQILDGQASFVLKSFAQANCLIYLHGENRVYERGDEVEIIPIGS